MFFSACKQFVSCSLAPVLIWTNDFFGTGSHLALQQSPWTPPMANKRHTHTMRGQRFGQTATRWRIQGDLVEKLHKEGSGTNKGCVGVCMGREQDYLERTIEEKKQSKTKEFRLRVVTPE